jgi:cbb3-type cytochrome oxidase maturation protein
MDVLYVLIPLSVGLSLIIGALIWWTVDHDQFADLEREGRRIFDEDAEPSSADLT